MAFNFVTKGWFQTMEEMELAYYGFSPSSLAAKSDAPVITTTTGARNVIYGSQLHVQLNMSANALGALPKKTWDKSGVRLVTAKMFTDGSPSLGQTQGGAHPETTKPTFALLPVQPKTMARTFEMSTAQVAMQGKDDVVQWPELVQYAQEDVMNDLNQQILTYNDTVPTNNTESIDRVVACHTEGATHTAAVGLDANDIDLWGMDRETAASDDTYVSAYVNHNSGVAQVLALPMLDDILAHIVPFWDHRRGFANKMWLTGYNTNMRLGQLINTQFRYVDYKPVEFGVNGIQTMPGTPTGNVMASYQAIPIIPDAYVDTHYGASSTGLEKLYGLDLDHINIMEAMPFQYAESDEILATGVLGRRGIYHSVLELVANKFKCHGKVISIT